MGQAPVGPSHIEGGGHTLQGTLKSGQFRRGSGARNNDIDAARVFWDFLQKQRR